MISTTALTPDERTKIIDTLADHYYLALTSVIRIEAEAAPYYFDPVTSEMSDEERDEAAFKGKAFEQAMQKLSPSADSAERFRMERRASDAFDLLSEAILALMPKT